MKTIQVSEATNSQLDWLVAKCWFTDRRVELSVLGHLPFGVEKQPGSGDRYTGWMGFNPSTDWSQGGPIIEREKINLEWWHTDQLWHSCMNERLQYDGQGEFIEGSDFHLSGPAPLIAAMRCYVASNLGNEVEIPDVLA
jgi:hypothetical protein